jgi:tRNA G18 (ribose-2'-O)-methylase SpoU
VHVERIDTDAVDWAQDERLADYRLARDPGLLRCSNVFLAEGRRVVDTLLHAGHVRTLSVLVDDRSLAWLESRDGTVPADVPVYHMPRSKMTQVGGHRFHQGCMASGKRPMPRSVIDVLAEQSTDARLVLAMQGVTDPDNVGAMFRTAEAFGADAVAMSWCADPLYRKALRTSMGASLRVPYAMQDWDDGLDTLGRAGFARLALTPGPDAETLDAVAARLAPGRPVALLVGSEGQGLRPETLTAADERVRIPMVPGADSLNVAASAAVALWALAPRERLV